MKEEDLNILGKFLFNYLFNKKLTIPIKINKRLRRTSAWFVYYEDKNKNQKPYIEISQNIINQSIYVIADTLAHELAHYYLYLNKKPFDDNDIEFKTLVFQKGISESNTTIIENGIIKYEYSQYVSKCTCGFKMNTYLFNKVNNFKPILICPKCKKRIINNKYTGIEYLEYEPTLEIKEAVDLYLDKHQNKS